ncbi:multiphosphoryl transfer protein 2 [includes phosphoenolpyruvate-protein phosphotransferase);phosphocarrier protein Hpr; fructose-like specific PTS system EIIA component] [Escherichia coli]|uniref:Multiphosphoryl transfer protein 2 [includes phosphoenolpyruvate-protein phosphotransferasephosphocarrier protein Hpr fructose-like specific PTS system EIIA component] n=1 Tax=Escherichia coli TaxID=562 RepID=A0A2X3M806_ECOLX|nr:multiphosphoryl transfer protein 2 [includes phosphoenolpyruvate-protein phosphotransferase);phosphocarrier protein Hpr; fructose-like specific PTS system EIIA component] [Escherichia coli]
MKNTPRCSPHNYGRFLRASAHGSLKIMIPMISSMEEILWVKKNWRKPKQQLP